MYTVFNSRILLTVNTRFKPRITTLFDIYPQVFDQNNVISKFVNNFLASPELNITCQLPILFWETILTV
jgi:hypothetical protein